MSEPSLLFVPESPDEWFMLGWKHGAESALRWNGRFSAYAVTSWFDALAILRLSPRSSYAKGYLAGHDAAWGFCP